MKILSLTALLTLFIIKTSSSQTFSKQNFKYTGKYVLQNVLNNTDDKGNKIAFFQCINKSSTITVYRVSVITFKSIISNSTEYYSQLKTDYSNLGKTNTTTLKGKKAMQVIENIEIEGHSMKQISISTLYKNKAITLILITNSQSYNNLLENFKQHFLFL